MPQLGVHWLVPWKVQPRAMQALQLVLKTAHDEKDTTNGGGGSGGGGSPPEVIYLSQPIVLGLAAQ